LVFDPFKAPDNSVPGTQTVSNGIDNIRSPSPDAGYQYIPEIIAPAAKTFQYLIDNCFAGPQKGQVQPVENTQHDSADVSKLKGIHPYNQNHHAEG